MKSLPWLLVCALLTLAATNGVAERAASAPGATWWSTHSASLHSPVEDLDVSVELMLSGEVVRLFDGETSRVLNVVIDLGVGPVHASRVTHGACVSPEGREPVQIELASETAPVEGEARTAIAAIAELHGEDARVPDVLPARWHAVRIVPSDGKAWGDVGDDPRDLEIVLLQGEDA